MAQSRRRRENDTFTDMAEALPIQENAKDLDKASILRVAINYLKLRELVGENDAEETADALEKDGAASENDGVTVETEETDSEISTGEITTNITFILHTNTSSCDNI